MASSAPAAMCGCGPTSWAHEGYGAVYERAATAAAIANPATFAWVMAPAVDGQTQEIAWVATLDVHARLSRVREVARGTRDHVQVDLVDTVRAALRDPNVSPRYAILAHNHPSGWAEPSDDDAELTIAATRACASAGLILLDHVVLAPERGGQRQFYSFREGRLWSIK